MSVAQPSTVMGCCSARAGNTSIPRAPRLSSRLSCAKSSAAILVPAPLRAEKSPFAPSSTSRLIGTVVTTWMTGRIAKMNSVAVFVSLLFGAWLWGVSGMLLGVPMIVILKVVAERLEGLEFVAELLAE